MKKKDKNTDQPVGPESNEDENNIQGYPLYPDNEDIYRKHVIEKNIDPEDTSKVKESIEKDKNETKNEKDFEDDLSGSDLDIPGSEMDDEQQNIGREDEENNYYSLGGDAHSNLDEV
jgi:hypothetical protein